MVPVLSFLLFFLVLAGIAYTLTTLRMGGRGAADGPARVGAALRARNRAVMLFFAVVLVVLAVLEALVTDVSVAMEDLQYSVGDLVNADPALIYETGNGSVSWGLYLAVLLGALGGLAVGTYVATRRYPVLRGLGVRDVI
jgi:hypothetical protein